MIIADLHLHSRYSRAVSQKMNLSEIAYWASKKGITLAAAPDWTHPIWFRELAQELKEVANGIYTLKHDLQSDIRFMLVTEIATIFTQGGRGRRLHNLLFAPSLTAAEMMNKKLRLRGANLNSDGRPIIGMSSRELLDMALNVDEGFILIPAHAWTPWFGIFGSQSGFDSITECFGDMTRYIYGVETGLSSDPIMNWRISELDKRSILSFSDAHSGPKMGREATVFVAANTSSRIGIREVNFSYRDIIAAIKQEPNAKLKIGYTIEFFPEEGKYHWSGHRDCGVRHSPQQIKEKGVICPVCKKQLTIGVENRVIDLAKQSRTENNTIQRQNSHGATFITDQYRSRRPFVSLIPLLEILAELHDGSPTKATRSYEQLTATIAPEFDILLRVPYDKLEVSGIPRLAHAIKMVRERYVSVEPGYDGVFGTIKIFKDEQTKKATEESPIKQEVLF